MKIFENKFIIIDFYDDDINIINPENLLKSIE